MKDVKNWIILLELLVIVVLLSKKTIQTTEVPNTIDTITVIKQERDSIVLEIAKTDTIIKYVKEQGIKNHNIIINQSIQDDMQYFTRYIYMYCEQ